jgi:hypothetical protein
MQTGRSLVHRLAYSVASLRSKWAVGPAAAEREEGAYLNRT